MDERTIDITPDGSGGINIVYLRGTVLTISDGWTIMDVADCTRVVYDATQISVHGSVDKEHWYDLVELVEMNMVFVSDQADLPPNNIFREDENLAGTRYIRIKVKGADKEASHEIR